MRNYLKMHFSVFFSFSARITIQEGSTIRSIQVAVSDVLKKGLIGIAEKKGNYSESDVDISYEGLYFLLRYEYFYVYF